MAEKSKKTGRSHKAPRRSGASPSFDKLRLNPDERTLKWRFHRGADQQWRWQKIAADDGVVAESRDAFPTYLECIADAAFEGYRPLPSAAGLREPR